MKRGVVRFPVSELDGLRRVGTRYFDETGRKLTRAAFVRMFVAAGLARINQERPLAEQLPLYFLADEKPRPRPRRSQDGPTLRKRVLDAVNERRAGVLTPAGVAHVLGIKGSDAVRNALLVLAEQGHIEKLAPGQYRAWPQSPTRTAARRTQGDEARA
ncbi:MAG: hypothetical protein QM820_04520 [Minicystis sp.]